MSDKNCLFNFRVNRDIRDRFMEICVEQGETASEKLTRHILETIANYDDKKNHLSES
jgi:hypothetical protein